MSNSNRSCKKRIDPITREEIFEWMPYDGKSYLFRFHHGVRCKGEFEIVTTYTAQKGYKIAVTSFIVRHEKPQPFVFKTDYLFNG